MNSKIYKLFNPDLNNFNNNQLYIHYNKFGRNENRIYSLQSFFKLYPYYNELEYKLYNTDLNTYDKIDLMVHWHLHGKNENRICSDIYFKQLYPNFVPIENNMSIYELKNRYHRKDNTILDLINNSNRTPNNFSGNLQYAKSIPEKNINNMEKQYVKSPKNLPLDKIDRLVTHSGRTCLGEDFSDLQEVVGESSEKIVSCLGVNSNSINNNLIKTNKNFIVAHINDSFENSLYNILIGINISLNNNYNFILTVENGKEYLLKKYTIFKHFKKIILNNIDNNDKNNILIKSNSLYNDNMINNNKKYNIIFNTIKNNDKPIKYFKNNFTKIKKLFNIDEKIYLLNYFNTLNTHKKNIGIYISSKNYTNTNFNYDNYYRKCLSFINFHIMNIFVFTDDIKYLENIIFLKQLNYYTTDKFEDLQLIMMSDCDYIISDESILSIISGYLSESKNIYFPSNINLNNLILFENINIIDDSFNDLYLQNNILISEYGIYILYKKNIYNIQKYNIEDNKNKLYINQDIIEKYNYKTSEFNFIKINNDFKSIDDIPYEIILNDNKYYYKLYNGNIHTQYELVDINNIKNNLPLNFKYINITNNKIESKESQNIIIPNYSLNSSLNIKINIIFIINSINNYTEYNILFMSNQNYNNYNIILFFNNISINKELYKDIKKQSNIFIFSSDEKLLNIEILSYLSKLADSNSLILIFNDYLVNTKLSLNYINLLFFCRKLLVTDFYSNENFELLFFKRELLNGINEDIINNQFSNDNTNYITILKKIFIKKYPENSFIEINIHKLKSYKSFENLAECEFGNTPINFIDFDKNDYLSLRYDNFSDERILLNNSNIKNKIQKLNNKTVEIKETNEDYLDFLIYLYKKCTFPNSIEEDLSDKIIRSEDSKLTSLFNLLNKSNSDIFLNYIKNRHIIDYNIFDKIKTYIINLDSRTDRLYQVCNICKKNGLFNFERFSGIVPTNDQIRNNKLINPRKILKKNNIEYLRGSLGCKMSHLEVLKRAKECSEDLILILEDDANFEDNFIIYLNLSLNYLKDKEWDILFLSSNLKNSTDAQKVHTNTLKIINGLTTTAQLFQKKNLEKIINIIENSECEIDNTYNDLLEHKYCVYPMCCYQRKSHSDIIGIELDYGKYNKKFFY